ncbi:MAG: hypothetical protein Ct9H300mP16_18310 [Pseudomonadota bacterium]|nr:MAG: hypothetical protein Ct9H300mP16_18310 [Pseudomonadota bacterium]
MVPAMYALMLLEPELRSTDLSSLKLGLFGGAPMPEDTIIGLKETLPDLVFPMVTGNRNCIARDTSAARAIANHTMSVGQPVHCGEIKIVDSEGRSCPPVRSVRY